MHFVIDGYNVIRRTPELAAREAEHGVAAGREALCNMLANAAQRSRDRFTVVFDGERGGSRGVAGGGVEVIFSSSRRSADEVILERCRPDVAIVSDDTEVMDGARRAGARSVSTREFGARIRDNRGRRSR